MRLLQVFAPLDQQAVLRAFSRADHDGRRGRDAERTRTGDDQDRDEEDERLGDGVVVDELPNEEGEARDQDDRGDEHGRHAVREPLDRCAGHLGVFDQLDDLIQRGVGSDAGGPDPQEAGLVDRRPDRRVPDPLLHGNRLARDHRFVDRGGALDDRAVDGDPFAGADDEEIVDLDELPRDLFLLPVADHVGGPRGQVHELTDCVAGSPFRELLEVFSQEDEADDYRGRVVVRPLVREGDARKREERDDRAVGPRRRRPNRDQDVHVRAAVPERVPGAVVEPPSGDELHGRRQDEEDEVHGPLEPREPPANPLAEPDHEKGEADPQAERREALETRDLLRGRGERLHARVRAEVVPPSPNKCGEVRPLVHVHATDRIRRHRSLGRSYNRPQRGAVYLLCLLQMKRPQMTLCLRLSGTCQKGPAPAGQRTSPAASASSGAPRASSPVPATARGRS